MNSFATIREILRIAKRTSLDDGNIQLILTDGNGYDNSDPNAAMSEDFSNKIIIDVMCGGGTDSDIINYCNTVTDIATSYGIINNIVIQPSMSYSHNISIGEYLDRYQPTGISVEWNGHDVTVNTLSGYRQG
jgi:hypothetical protein